MKLLMILSVALALSGGAFAQTRAVLQDEAARAAWREDTAALMDQLIAIHPDPFHRFPESEFRRVSAQLQSDIPYLSDNQIVAELARMAAMLDGHTYLFLLQPEAGFHLYPIRLYAFAEGVYVVNAAPEHHDLIGLRLLAINGIPAQAVLDMVAPYNSADNLYTWRLWLPVSLIMPELLQSIGVINTLDQPHFTFVNAAGELVNADLEPITVAEYVAWNEESAYPFIGLPWQDLLTYPNGSDEAFWHTRLEDTQTLYIQYNHVASRSPSGETIGELAQVIGSAEETAERLVIDLRRNLGGDNTTYRPLLRAIQQSDFNQPGRLFLLIGRGTFSAAKDFAMDVARDTHAILIGEPTGGRPSNYDNGRTIQLPHSGLEVAIATRYVPRQDATDAPWLAPDIFTPVRAADFFAGRDPALETALHYEGE